MAPKQTKQSKKTWNEDDSDTLDWSSGNYILFDHNDKGVAIGQFKPQVSEGDKLKVTMYTVKNGEARRGKGVVYISREAITYGPFKLVSGSNVPREALLKLGLESMQEAPATSPMEASKKRYVSPAKSSAKRSRKTHLVDALPVVGTSTKPVAEATLQGNIEVMETVVPTDNSTSPQVPALDANIEKDGKAQNEAQKKGSESKKGGSAMQENDVSKNTEKEEGEAGDTEKEDGSGDAEKEADEAGDAENEDVAGNMEKEAEEGAGDTEKEESESGDAEKEDGVGNVEKETDGGSGDTEKEEDEADDAEKEDGVGNVEKEATDGAGDTEKEEEDEAGDAEKEDGVGKMEKEATEGAGDTEKEEDDAGDAEKEDGADNMGKEAEDEAGDSTIREKERLAGDAEGEEN